MSSKKRPREQREEQFEVRFFWIVRRRTVSHRRSFSSLQVKVDAKTKVLLDEYKKKKRQELAKKAANDTTAFKFIYEDEDEDGEEEKSKPSNSTDADAKVTVEQTFLRRSNFSP